MTEMGYVLALLLGALLSVRRVWLRLSRQEIVWYTDPVALFTGAWLIQSVAYALPIFVNRESVEGRHIFYIVTCHVAFLIGVMLVPQTKPQAVTGPRAPQITLPMIWSVGLIGLLGNFAVCYDGLSMSSVGMLERINGTGLEAIRMERVAAVAMLNGGPVAFLEFLSAASTVFVCLLTAGVLNELNLQSSQKRWLSFTAGFTLVFVAFNALMIAGGRMGLVLLLMAAILGAKMDPKRALFAYLDRVLGRAKVLTYALLLIASLWSVWYFATSFAKQRIGTASPLVALSQYHRASLTPWVEEASSQHEDVQFALLNFSYLTVPLTTPTCRKASSQDHIGANTTFQRLSHS
jgi:hypothetical protein